MCAIFRAVIDSKQSQQNKQGIYVTFFWLVGQLPEIELSLSRAM
jgi:hypothetical protein